MLTVASLLAAYLGSYLWLSRRGYAEADKYHLFGFYYLPPMDSKVWRRENYGCEFVFRPLNVVDRFLGSGRYPAAEPLWSLSK